MLMEFSPNKRTDRVKTPRQRIVNRMENRKQQRLGHDKLHAQMGSLDIRKTYQSNAAKII